DVERGLEGERQPASQLRPSRVPVGDERERLSIQLDGAFLRPAALRLGGRRREILDGANRVAPVPRMACERRGRLADLSGCLLEKARDLRVPLLASRARERLVGDVANENVLE